MFKNNNFGKKMASSKKFAISFKKPFEAKSVAPPPAPNKSIPTPPTIPNKGMAPQPNKRPAGPGWGAPKGIQKFQKAPIAFQKPGSLPGKVQTKLTKQMVNGTMRKVGVTKIAFQRKPAGFQQHTPPSVKVPSPVSETKAKLPTTAEAPALVGDSEHKYQDHRLGQGISEEISQEIMANEEHASNYQDHRMAQGVSEEISQEIMANEEHASNYQDHRMAQGISEEISQEAMADENHASGLQDHRMAHGISKEISQEVMANEEHASKLQDHRVGHGVGNEKIEVAKPSKFENHRVGRGFSTITEDDEESEDEE